MTMGFRLALCAGVAAIAAASVVQAQPAQRVTGPVATYWMSTQTTTGFGMPSMGAGGAAGRPDSAAMMRAMRGQQVPDAAARLAHRLGRAGRRARAAAGAAGR